MRHFASIGKLRPEMKYTGPQSEAITAGDVDVCVAAGAGSGKTMVLVGRILHLIEEGRTDLSGVVAITFTDKAAAEMKARLRRKCRRKSENGDRETMNRWRSIERQVDGARISTIHSFCMGILKENALALGWDPDFRVLTDAEKDLLYSETVECTVHRLLEDEDPAAFRLCTEFGVSRVSAILASLLNQRAAIERVLAGHEYTDSDSIVKHWREVTDHVYRERLLSLAHSIPLQHFQLELEALEGHCESASDAREALRREMLSALSRIRSAKEAQAIEQALAHLRTKSAKGGSKKNWSPEESFGKVSDIWNRLKAFLETYCPSPCDPGVETTSAALTSDLVAVYRTLVDDLRDAKIAQNARDFDDLIIETAQVLRQRPDDPDSVCARAAQSIKHLLIDEFQDTDSLQLDIVRTLASVPGGPRLFIVGDAKQSIYYFRGAEVEVFREAQEISAKTIPMKENFRSSPRILSFVNEFFRKSELLAGVERDYVGLEPMRTDPELRRIEFLIPNTLDEDASADAYRRMEAELIAARLTEMCAGPERVNVHDKESDSFRPARFGDAAILLRSLNDVHHYEQALRLANVPYVLVAGKGFHDRQEIADLRALLAFIVDPYDEVALLGVLRSPVAGLSDEALFRLCGGVAKHTPLVRAFAEGARCGDPEQDQRLDRTRALVEELRAHQTRPLAEFLQLVLDRTAYEAILLGQFLGVQRAGNLRKVCALAASFQRSGSARLPAFVRYLTEMAAEEVREGEAAVQTEGADAVILMTIHKAKGLEFPIVAIADMSRKHADSHRMPAIVHRRLGLAMKSYDAIGNLQAPRVFDEASNARKLEERAEIARVLYVAMTRARDHLLLCGAPDTRGDQHWMAALNAQFGLFDRRHGEEFQGDGWSARMVRKLSPRVVERTAEKKQTMPSREILLKRISPVAASRSDCGTVRATLLAAAMAGKTAVDQSGGRDTEAGADPQARGTLVHKFFEVCEWSSPLPPQIDALLRMEYLAPDREADVHRELLGIAERVAASPLGRRMASARNLQREVPFMLRIGGVIVSGKVDAVVDDNVIIDYKTGHASPERMMEYEFQIRLYALALTELRGATSLEGFLFLVDEKEESRWIHAVDVSRSIVEDTRRTAADTLDRLLSSPLSAVLHADHST